MYLIPAKHYSNISDIYIENINDSIFITLILLGCIVFYTVQKIGENVHKNVLKDKQKQMVPLQLFGTYFQSSFHALIGTIGSYFILYKYLNRSDEMEVINKTDEDYIYIICYKISTVLSVSYFITLMPYELFGIDQTMIFRIAMLIHHSFGIFCQSLVFLTNPLTVFISAMTVQCEISTLFANLRIFGLSLDNKYVYFIGGIGTLVTYPLSRIVFLAYSIYISYNLKDKMMIYISVEGFYFVVLGQIFVVLMSSAYSYMMFKNPTKIFMLQTANNEYTEKAKQS